MPANVKFDGKNIQKLKSKIKGQRSMKVNVGFLQEDTAKIALINEYGATIKVTDKMRGYFYHTFKTHLKKSTTEIKIPPRPFMDMTFKNNYRKWEKTLQQILKKNNYDIEKSLSLMGEIIKSDIQLTIESGNFTPNSPLTVKAKGTNSPLINTGNMRDSIEYEVIK